MRYFLYLLLITVSVQAQWIGADGWMGWTGNRIFQAETDSLLGRMEAQPSATRKIQIDNLIKSLKNKGIWSKLDVLYVFAAHTEQAALLNWVGDYSNATKVNSPTFTTDRGFAGNGSSSYLNSNYNTATQAVNLSQNSASIGIYSRTELASNVDDCGTAKTTATTGGLYVSHRAANNSSYWRSNTGTTESTVITTSLGWKIVSRTASNSATIYQNTIAKETITTVSSTPVSLVTYIGATNVNGSPSGYSPRQFSAFFVGAGLDSASVVSIVNFFETYLDAVGAGVL